MRKNTSTLRILGATLQARGFAHTGVRCASARGFGCPRLNSKWNQKEEASTLRLLVLGAVLEWEFRKRGKLVLPVPAYNSSRECFQCGGINRNLTLEDRVFHCPYCGFTLDRDLNASLVLLKRAGWVPPAVPVELRPIPPLPSLGLKRRQGGAMKQEAPRLQLRGSSPSSSSFASSIPFFLAFCSSLTRSSPS